MDKLDLSNALMSEDKRRPRSQAVVEGQDIIVEGGDDDDTDSKELDLMPFTGSQIDDGGACLAQNAAPRPSLTHPGPSRGGQSHIPVLRSEW